MSADRWRLRHQGQLGSWDYTTAVNWSQSNATDTWSAGWARGSVLLSLGVKNVLDTDPPFTRQAQSFQVGYDPALADPTGRFYYASIRYRFK